MGKHQIRLLKFLIRNRGWCSYGHDRSTVDAVNSLRSYGLIETNEFRQMRLATNE